MAIASWTAISTAQTDYDSPLDQTLFDSIRTNFDHIRQALYGQRSEAGYYTPVWGHQHDAVDSAPVGLSEGEYYEPSLGLTSVKVALHSKGHIPEVGEDNDSTNVYWAWEYGAELDVGVRTPEEKLRAHGFNTHDTTAKPAHLIWNYHA